MKKNKRITCADERMITLSDPAAKPGKDLAKVDGVAYSGGTFRQVWDSRDMAVDLAGDGTAFADSTIAVPHELAGLPSRCRHCRQ